MTKKFDDDEIIQDLGPLHVPRIEMNIEMFTESEENMLRLYNEVRKWVNLHQPQVLWQQDMIRQTYYLYFETRELYVEFVQKFPAFLRGSDE